MAQFINRVLPVFTNTDSAFEKLDPNESHFIKGVTANINSNPNQQTGTNNPTNEGQNESVLSLCRSNKIVPNVILPEGYNLNHGSFESEITQESYEFKVNSNGNHGVYVLDGNTGMWQKVIVDPELNFSEEQEAYIAENRVKIRVVYDKNHNILEKYLIFTDSKNWQKYISVIASIKTNGFDAKLFPYWTLQPPHFDRRELFEYAVRPPMYKPEAATIPNTVSNATKVSRIIDTAFQFANYCINTDGRTTTFSPYSLPVYVRTEDFISNPDSLPKNISIKIYAGSPLTEKIVLCVRQCKKNDDGTVNTLEWGDWVIYETIDKFNNCGINAPEIIGTEYWLRTGQWSNYNYDPVFNTITYIFDNSRSGTFINPLEAARLQTDMPQLSNATGDLNDAVALANNRYFYDNFGCDVLNKLDIIVKEKAEILCTIPLRKVRLYAYIGRVGDEFTFFSQVGYYLGDDTQVRFGGTYLTGADNHTVIDSAESKYFQLDFSDRDALRAYCKGKKYYADGTWYQVNSDNSLVKIENIYDGSNADILINIQNIILAGGYFVCVFDLILPAGRYDIALGRHNVASSGDYRNKSTYVAGIANSRVKSGTGNGIVSIKPDAIVSFSKEMEIDCTAGDVDVWGNNKDMFYIYCPSITQQGNKKYRFTEGYLYENANNALPVELFPYIMNHSAIDAGGNFTDKNGFYWAHTKVANSEDVDVQFFCKLNCVSTNFIIPTSSTGSGWKVNAPAYLSDHNAGVTGDCNRIILNGTITSIDGLIPLSNIAVSIVDGSTALTKQDGTFTLVIHNGRTDVLRVSNIYINAGSNFNITIANCGYIPLQIFNESLVPCYDCTERIYPAPLNLKVNVISLNQVSLKEGGSYSVGIAGADLAGRLMYVNVIKNLSVPTFLERGNTLPTYFQLMIKAALQLTNLYPDIKWLSPYFSKNLSQLHYVEWVGDKIVYIDNNGNVVNDPASAVFCSITITSLYNYNIQNNFSTLATYQFVNGDFLRILDDGDGQLFDIATYGSEINLQVQGTNYNQAAINAGLLPNISTVPVINNNINTTTAQTEHNTAVTLFVKYDSRLDKLIDKTGFWIEIYTPAKINDVIPFMECAGFYPVINGELAIFTGYDANAKPKYDYPTAIGISFWDTYYLSRNITIPNAGDKYFSHPFESQNISDSFGRNITSGGRQGIENKEAKQTWYGGDVIKSDEFINNGFINGLATFRSENRKDFSSYPWGAIQAILNQRSIILFVCENDFFTTDYNFHYAYPNEQGIMVTNLDGGLSTPRQKAGENFGLAPQDISAIGSYDKYVFWYDRKNQAFVLCNYQSAKDIADIIGEGGKRYGVLSYLTAKTEFITNWNLTHDLKERFDVLVGIDMNVNNIMLSFRPRRNKTSNTLSFINQNRGINLQNQETLVYNLDSGRWVRNECFAPESYAKLRGNFTGTQLISYAAGVPYTHNDTQSASFLNYYGIQCEPVFFAVANDKVDSVKVFQGISHDSNENGWFIDLIYTNEKNSFSYLSLNQFKKKENVFYAALLRNMNSYPPIEKEQLFRSMIFDGKRNFGRYTLFRFVGDPSTLNIYTQLQNIFYRFTQSGDNQK